MSPGKLGQLKSSVSEKSQLMPWALNRSRMVYGFIYNDLWYKWYKLLKIKVSTGNKNYEVT